VLPRSRMSSIAWIAACGRARSRGMKVWKGAMTRRYTGWTAAPLALPMA
jgi:hypothetical protein